MSFCSAMVMEVVLVLRWGRVRARGGTTGLSLSSVGEVGVGDGGAAAGTSSRDRDLLVIVHVARSWRYGVRVGDGGGTIASVRGRAGSRISSLSSVWRAAGVM